MEKLPREYYELFEKVGAKKKLSAGLELPPESEIMYNMKNIGLTKSFPITESLFEPGIAETIQTSLYQLKDFIAFITQPVD